MKMNQPPTTPPQPRLPPEAAKALDDFITQFEYVYELWQQFYPAVIAADYEPNLMPKLNKAMGDIYEERQYLDSYFMPDPEVPPNAT
jgi:hypothetical protein